MCVAKGDRVKIDYLKLEHVYEMRNWGKHEDELYKDYNFPKLTYTEVNQWFRSKTNIRNKKNYCIKNIDGKVIGYIILRKINRLLKKGVLGIVIDPNYVNKGYGTEAINIFLKYVFYDFKINKIILQVAKFNKRAIKCYEKCGFKKEKEYEEKFEDQDIDIFGDDKYKNVRDSFNIRSGKLYVKYYEMIISKKHYSQRHCG